MDVQRALRFVFRDPSWPKRLAVAMLILTVPGVLLSATIDRIDEGSMALLFGVSIVLSTIGSGLLYAHYSHIVESIAREGRDLPLPATEPLIDLGGRAVVQIVFHIVLVITMIPLFCIVGCPILLLAGAVQSGGSVVAVFFAGALFTLTAGAVFICYLMIAFSRFLVTDDFGGSLNPGKIIRLFRLNPGDWATAAFLPAVISIGLSLGRALVNAFLPNDGVFDDVVNALIATPITAYVTLVGFHLAGQAYRLAATQDPTLGSGAAPAARLA